MAEPFTTTHARRLLIAMPALLVMALTLPRVARELSPTTVKPSDSIVIGAPIHVGPDQIAPTAEHLRRIDEALAATTFPELEPSIVKLGLDGAKRDIWNRCLSLTLDVDKACTFGPPPGSGTHTAVVVGDSVAASWAVTIGTGLTQSGWTTYAFVIGQCPAAFVKAAGRRFAPGMTEKCDQFHREIVDVVARLHPDLLVLSSSSTALLQLASGAQGAEAVAEYRDGLVDAVQSMASSAGAIVILSPPPVSKTLSMCATAGAAPSSCAGRVTRLWFTHAGADRAAAAKAHVPYLDAALLFCNGAGWCPAFVGTTPVRYDGTHVTKTFAEEIAPQVADALLREWRRATSAGGPSSP